ncbi:MAG: MotA/TolQ/ExbB proton channel family protein, partial [Steroidobacteraceae bacterium]
ITTAAGLAVAIPATIAYRLLRGKVERLVVAMEKEAMKLVQAIEQQPGARGHAASQVGSRGAAA